MVVDTFDPSIPEAEAEAVGFLQVYGQPGLYNKFHDNQRYREKACLKKVNKTIHIILELNNPLPILTFSSFLPPRVFLEKQNFSRYKLLNLTKKKT